jgi:hypothetical protein
MTEPTQGANARTISSDMAEAEFDRFTEAMDLDIATDDMDQDDLTAFKKVKRRLLRAIGNGSLIINEDGEAEFMPQKDDSRYDKALRFRQRTGGALMSMDSKKKGQDVAKTYAVMAQMCGVEQKVFARLLGEDGKVCEAIFTLLMD